MSALVEVWRKKAFDLFQKRHRIKRITSVSDIFVSVMACDVCGTRAKRKRFEVYTDTEIQKDFVYHFCEECLEDFPKQKENSKTKKQKGRGMTKAEVEAVIFLYDTEKTIKNYRVKARSWLRPAILSHLRVSFLLSNERAEEILNRFLTSE